MEWVPADFIAFELTVLLPALLCLTFGLGTKLGIDLTLP